MYSVEDGISLWWNQGLKKNSVIIPAYPLLDKQLSTGFISNCLQNSWNTQCLWEPKFSRFGGGYPWTHEIMITCISCMWISNSSPTPHPYFQKIQYMESWVSKPLVFLFLATQTKSQVPSLVKHYIFMFYRLIFADIVYICLISMRLWS